MINKAKAIIKGYLYYQVIRDKTLDHIEKEIKIAKLNEMLQDSTFALECMKIAQKCLKQAIIELEEK